MYSNYYGGNWMLFLIPAMLFASYAQMKINSSFKKYSKISSNTGLSGFQIARIILDRNGLNEVQIKPVAGTLTDHYDPRTKTVSLSSSIYNGSSIASMSVAAHEVGHAIQHAEGYFPLVLRNNMAPLVSFGTRYVWIFIMLGFIVSPFFLELGIMIFLGVVLFQVVTLPVEFNASKRALRQLEDGITPVENIKPAKEVLNAAALTYVAGTLVAVAQLLRLLSMRNRRRN